MLHHISDEMVERAADARQAQDVVEEAFRAFGRGQAAMQQRERIEAEGVKLSTLGAVVPHLGIAGAKVYTTIAGRFSFVILLFSCLDGRPLATMDAAALTRRRTAASSVLMARRMARPDAGRLGVFGLGAQGASTSASLPGPTRCGRSWSAIRGCRMPCWMACRRKSACRSSARMPTPSSGVPISW